MIRKCWLHAQPSERKEVSVTEFSTLGLLAELTS